MGQCLMKSKVENSEELSKTEDMTGKGGQKSNAELISRKTNPKIISEAKKSINITRSTVESKEVKINNALPQLKSPRKWGGVAKNVTKEKALIETAVKGAKDIHSLTTVQCEAKDTKKIRPIVMKDNDKENSMSTSISIEKPTNQNFSGNITSNHRLKSQDGQTYNKCAMFEKIIEESKQANEAALKAFNNRNVGSVSSNSSSSTFRTNISGFSSTSSRTQFTKGSAINYSVTNKLVNLTKDNECDEKRLISNKELKLSTSGKSFTHQVATSQFNTVHKVVSANEKVIERTINIETRKIKKDGKWVEETLKSLIHTNEKGSKTSTRKANYRNLLPEEVAEHEIFLRGDTPPGISPTPDEEAEPESEPEPAVIKNNKEPRKEPIKKPVKKAQAKVPKRVPLVAKKPEVVRPKDDPQTFAKEVLAAVNNYRRTHGVEPLTEDEKLNKMAAEWATRLASLEKMEHGDKKGLGENIYCKTSSQPWFKMSGEEVVENWYNEVEDHDYNEEPSAGYLKTGHFTQLIWADTEEMGVAYARNKNGHMAFVVSYFSPKGNWIGEFKDKVPPPGGFSKTKNDASPKRAGPTTRRTLPPISSPPTSAEDLKKSSKSKRSKNLNKAPPLPPRNNKFNLHTDRLAETPYIYSPGTRKKDLTRNQNKSPTISSRNSTAISSNSLDFDRQADTPNNIYSSPKTSRSKASSVQSSAVSSRNTTANSTTTRNSRNSITNSLKSVVESPRKMNEKFAEEFLDAHNKYRKIHGVGTLTLSDKLSEFAQEWAEENAKVDRMDHREDNEYGENIYRKWSPNKNEVMLGSEPVDDWYSEINDYDFGQEPLDLNCGHFTQIVWADTEEVGVGLAKSNSGSIYVVGNYYPPGNYVGQFSRMVPPPE